MKIHSYIIYAEYNVTEECTDIIKRSQLLYLSGREILSILSFNSAASQRCWTQNPRQGNISVGHNLEYQCLRQQAILRKFATEAHKQYFHMSFVSSLARQEACLTGTEPKTISIPRVFSWLLPSCISSQFRQVRNPE